MRSIDTNNPYDPASPAGSAWERWREARATFAAEMAGVNALSDKLAALFTEVSRPHLLARLSPAEQAEKRARWQALAAEEAAARVAVTPRSCATRSSTAASSASARVTRSCGV